MPLQKLVLTPGINKENTNYGNEGGYYDGDKIRFRSGNPEKIGGWVRLSANTYLGTARTLWNWAAYDGSNYLGVGTNLKYYIEQGGAYFDITPLRSTLTTATTNNCFTTTIGSATVLVTIALHSALDGDFVTFSGSSAVGGIPAALLNINTQITYLTANTFTFVAGAVATSSTTGGGTAIVAAFEISIGYNTATIGTGWGVPTWNGGGIGTTGWGMGYTSGGGIAEQLRLWANDNYGQDLVIAPRGGELYYWVQSTGTAVRAQLLSDISTTAGYSGDYVPNKTNQVIASAIQRFIITLGSNPYIPGNTGSTFDPMLVRWSDQANPYQWIPSITNQSGEFRLSHGSYIVSGQVTQQQNLIWTDAALYSMQYLGPPYVWSFQLIMDNISIISPNAAVSVNSITYWMGQDKFYVYSGRVDTLACTLKQYVFEDINLSQGYQIFSGSNAGYNEVWWFYCSASSSTIDKYVIYNYVDQVWYSGTLARTAWIDSAIRTYPMAACYDNRILYHEASVDDESGIDPAPISAYVQSSDFDIGDGDHFGFVWRMLPDVNFNGSRVNNPQVSITLTPRRNSGASYGTANVPLVISGDNYAPPNSAVYTIQTFTGQVYTRLRARQMAFKISSDSLGVAWQLGSTRFDLRPDGRR